LHLDRATGDEKTLKRRDTGDIVGAIEDTQNQSLNVLGDMAETADATHDIAGNIVSELGKQKEKLQEADRDLGDMDDGITRSKKYLRGIIMSLQRDKCIRAMLFIVLAGALFILIWSLIDPNFSLIPSSSPPSPPPPPATPTPTPTPTP